MGKLPLPLPWESVTADVSQRDNEGARCFQKMGGWRGIKNASSRKYRNARCREYGSSRIRAS